MSSRSVLAALLCGATISPAVGQSVALNCTPAAATRQDFKDPIVNIRVHVNGDRASIMHEAESGVTYERADQYLATSARWAGTNFTWIGRNYKNPAVRMKGSVELTPSGYSYREQQINERTEVPYEMVSSCVPEATAPRVAELPKTPEHRSAVSYDFAVEKERMVSVMQERLDECAEPKMFELVKSGEMAAALALATLDYCSERVNDLTSAQMLRDGLPNERENLYSAIKQRMLARAVQIRADAKQN